MGLGVVKDRRVIVILFLGMVIGMADLSKTQQLKKNAFLAAYAEVGNVTRAAEIAEVDRSMHYYWMANDPDYKDQFREAENQANDRLEQEARRRAVEGVTKPVFHKGEQCGAVQEYSDTLLIFLLKGALPDKYKERQNMELTGKGGGPIQHQDVSKMTDEELDKELEELRSMEGTE